jgi:multidrug efflux pump subunit AcrA (membrane-fusion protein)
MKFKQAVLYALTAFGHDPIYEQGGWMVRKIFSGILILLSAIFLVLSIVGIGAVWFYNEPLTREVTGQLKQIDIELAQAEATLISSEKELERALRIVDATQAALEKLTEQTDSADSLLDTIQSTLDDRLLPELKTTRTRIDAARATLENLQSILTSVSSFVPAVGLDVPDKLLTDLLASARSLDTEIANMEVLATQASTFVGDTSYLLGGDLSQTRDSLEMFLSSIQDYEKKVARWREQGKGLLEGAPTWIDQASIALTIFLLWFGLSQFGLLLHGLNLQRGRDPLIVLRRQPVKNRLIKDEIDLEHEE